MTELLNQLDAWEAEAKLFREQFSIRDGVANHYSTIDQERILTLSKALRIALETTSKFVSPLADKDIEYQNWASYMVKEIEAVMKGEL